MKIGGSYRLGEIRRSHWESRALDLRMTAYDLTAAVESKMERIAIAIAQVADQLKAVGIEDSVLAGLSMQWLPTSENVVSLANPQK
jgi:hypothetical protein